MALNYVPGGILNDNLQRTANLSFNTTMLYLDVVNNRIGINNNTPGGSLDVHGNVVIGGIVIPNIGNVTFANTYVTNVANPKNPQDAATKNYVDQKTATYANSNLIISNTTIYPNFSSADITLAPQGIGNLLIPTGNVKANGAVYASKFYGDGGYLSNITASSTNFSNVASNIIPSQNVVYSLGNVTNQWKELWVSGNTIYMGGTSISLVNGSLYVGNNQIVTDSPNGVTQVNDIEATGSVVADLFVGDGSGLTNLPAGDYSNANVAAYLPVYSGNISASAVTADYFIGDGGKLSNIQYSNVVGKYTDSNVASYLPTNSANVSAAYFKGDGSQLTNLPVLDAYSNANVASYLPVYGGNILVDTIQANTVAVGSTFTKNFTTTTASTAVTILCQFDIQQFNSFNYNVTAVDNTGHRCQVTKIIAATINNLVNYSEYGVVNVGTSLGSYEVTAFGGNLILLVHPTTTNLVEYSVSVTNYT